jgi:NADH-quinone oxidoreductase subunit J
MEPILFYLFGAISVVSALAVVTRRNPMVAAVYLILCLFSVAALYALRQAHFLAALQVIVYAGAVVVLFIFVIMLLNVPEERLPEERANSWMMVAAVAGGLFLVETAVAARYAALPRASNPVAGSVEAVGQALFTDYLLAFEVTSVLLLAAVIGAMTLAKKKI